MSDYAKALEAQRKAFEAQFGSIEDLGFEDKSKQVSSEEEEEEENGDEMVDDDDFIKYSDAEVPSEDDSEVGNDFKGFSDDEAGEQSQQADDRGLHSAIVVKASGTDSQFQAPSKRELRAIRSGKILTMDQQRQRDEAFLKKQAELVKDTNDEQNLKNDLELQRLLKESHFLGQKNDFSGAELTLETIDFDEPIGKARRRTLDSRIKHISETNISAKPKKLEKMPISMRKGMIHSAKHKIEKYEREARENGIILSKVKKGQFRELNAGKSSTSVFDRIGTGENRKPKFRNRGLKIHTVGKSTKNGLILSSKDIEKINGPSFDKGKGKKGKRR